MSLLDHVVVPVASDEDASATCDALRPSLGEVERVTAVHVVEKGGGAIDKAPVDKRRADAAEFLAVVEAELGEAVAVDTRVAFGTDIVETIFETATEVDATAVAFRPRGGSRIVRLITGAPRRGSSSSPTCPSSHCRAGRRTEPMSPNDSGPVTAGRAVA